METHDHHARTTRTTPTARDNNTRASTAHPHTRSSFQGGEGGGVMSGGTESALFLLVFKDRKEKKKSAVPFGTLLPFVFFSCTPSRLRAIVTRFVTTTYEKASSSLCIIITKPLVPLPQKNAFGSAQLFKYAFG